MKCIQWMTETWKPKAAFLLACPLMLRQSPSKTPERHLVHYSVNLLWASQDSNSYTNTKFYFFTLKSIVPLLSASNVLKTFSQNLSASPAGKNILYISQKVFGVSFPLGQSCDSLYNKQWQPQRQRPKRQKQLSVAWDNPATLLKHCPVQHCIDVGLSEKSTVDGSIKSNIA